MSCSMQDRFRRVASSLLPLTTFDLGSTYTLVLQLRGLIRLHERLDNLSGCSWHVDEGFGSLTSGFVFSRGNAEEYIQNT